MALLAKLGWRLIKENDKLWARVIHDKYLKNRDFLSATPFKTRFRGWRSILVGKEVLVKGLKWRLGTGNTVSFWKDKWLADVRLIDIVTSLVGEDEANKTIDQYYDARMAKT
ncbi:putative ribonuclease H protein [Corchorus olitorius]|uniref:Ribonuclease H protein n=1 Tax=Corchorus olitorius TaxID=93759 RepID=A0A1R3KPD1_9ROSI|nr:putative ribonuclease H protein [Corchorus olitorius]